MGPMDFPLTLPSPPVGERESGLGAGPFLVSGDWRCTGRIPGRHGVTIELLGIRQPRRDAGRHPVTIKRAAMRPAFISTALLEAPSPFATLGASARPSAP